MRISGWSSDVCSSDLVGGDGLRRRHARAQHIELVFLEIDPLAGDEALLLEHQAGIALLGIEGHLIPRGIGLRPIIGRPRVVELVERAVALLEIGSASCGGSVCQYVEISVLAGS